jgi:hypothetical protein
MLASGLSVQDVGFNDEFEPVDGTQFVALLRADSSLHFHFTLLFRDAAHVSLKAVRVGRQMSTFGVSDPLSESPYMKGLLAYLKGFDSIEEEGDPGAGFSCRIYSLKAVE